MEWKEMRDGLLEIPKKYLLNNTLMMTRFEEAVEENGYVGTQADFYEAYYQTFSSQKEIDLEKIRDAIMLLERLESLELWKTDVIKSEKKKIWSRFTVHSICFEVILLILFKIGLPQFLLGLPFYAGLVYIFWNLYNNLKATKESELVQSIDNLSTNVRYYALENPFVASLTSDFDDALVLYTLAKYINSGRADNLKEAMNLYAQEVQYQELQASISSLNEGQTFGQYLSREINKKIYK